MNLHRFARYALSLTTAAILVACGGGGSDAGVQPNTASAPEPADSVPVASSAGAFMAEKILADGSGVETTGIDSRLRDARGKVNVWVALNQNSLASARAQLAQQTGIARVRALSSGQGQASAAQAEPTSVKSAMARVKGTRMTSRDRPRTRREKEEKTRSGGKYWRGVIPTKTQA